jgi:hypothetical protein
MVVLSPVCMGVHAGLSADSASCFPLSGLLLPLLG